jgi:hypothetical protein
MLQWRSLVALVTGGNCTAIVVVAKLSNLA